VDFIPRFPPSIVLYKADLVPPELNDHAVLLNLKNSHITYWNYWHIIKSEQPVLASIKKLYSGNSTVCSLINTSFIAIAP
jgi:hypothetical protein